MKFLFAVFLFFSAVAFMESQGAVAQEVAAQETMPSTVTAKEPTDVVAPAPKKTKKKKTKKSVVTERSTKKMTSFKIGANPAFGEEELDIAQRIDEGVVPCAQGVSVTVKRDVETPGYFTVQGKNFSYHRMAPVRTASGAIRLEDPKAGAIWLQLANKSMLINRKTGVRQADDCVSPAQSAVIAAMKESPLPGLLDDPAAVRGEVFEAAAPAALPASALQQP